MRCPKCHYISFGSADRCRNCGYDFSLVDEAPPPDLPIHTADEPVGPLVDLPLSGSAPAPVSTARAAVHAPVEPPPPPPSPPRAMPPPAQAPASAPAQAPASAQAPAPAPAQVARFDLPLFSGDDTPLVNPQAVPRAPLSVRRASPAAQRAPAEPFPDEGRLGLEPGDAERAEAAPPFKSEAELAESAGAGRVASPWARLAAGIVDLLILAAIDASVVYFTLRVLGIPPAQIARLPAPPLVAFLLLLNGGYLAIFTAAGGQTIGKMLTGIRVVPVIEPPRDAAGLPLGTAVLRTAAYFVSLLPAGLGFLPILFSADRRALHDRLAETRVVRA